MSGVGGADSASGPSGSEGVGGASEASAADTGDSADVDAATESVTEAEVAGAAESVTEATDGYEAAAAEDAEAATAAEEAEEAGLCIGTRTECEQRAADEMTAEEAIEALDGKHLHEPDKISPAEARGLEELSKQPHLSDRARQAIESFLEDYRNGTDRLNMDPHLGRPDAISPRDIPDPHRNIG